MPAARRRFGSVGKVAFMDFSLSEEQAQLQGMLREFAEDRIAPHSRAWDEECTFPAGTLRELAALGLAGIYVSAEHGGSNLGRMEAALAFEELARADASLAAFLSIHNMVAWMVDRFGDDSLRADWLPSLSRMDRIAAYCLTEPESGSDAAALRTRAEPEGNDGYRLNGTKAFISGAGEADVYAVMCRTGGPGPGGVSCLLVPAGAEGLSFGSQERKMGWRNQPTALVHFRDVRIPAANRLGVDGDGFRYAMAGLDGGRINISACSIGAAAWALDAARDYTLQRKAFGRPIAENQSIAFRLADMATGLEASRLMVWRAAAALDRGEPDATRRCAMAKVFSTEACWRIVDDALQIHGGYGYIRDYGLEHRLRDIRVHRILEGTSEIMRVIISRHLLADG